MRKHIRKLMRQRGIDKSNHTHTPTNFIDGAKEVYDGKKFTMLDVVKKRNEIIKKKEKRKRQSNIFKVELS